MMDLLYGSLLSEDQLITTLKKNLPYLIKSHFELIQYILIYIDLIIFWNIWFVSKNMIHIIYFLFYISEYVI